MRRDRLQRAVVAIFANGWNAEGMKRRLCSAEDECEARAEVKFTTTKTAGCPACIGPLPALAAFVDGQVDGALNGDIWCALPSGAFLQ